MSAVTARLLIKRYATTTALDGVDLDVLPGEVFGLLGPNGAGKSTLVRILVTLLRADAGSASVAGFDVASQVSDVRRRIGYVPQEVTADRYMTARESLHFFCDLYHLSAPRRKARVEELLDLVGLREAADKTARGYSGGMKKKLDLACGLVHEPDVLFLDEPSLGLDVAMRRTVWDYLESLKKRGTTIVLCTNVMEEADRLCDRVAIIDRGRISATGAPGELRAQLGGDVVTLEPSTAGAGAAEGAVEAAVRALATALEAEPFVGSTSIEGPRVHAWVDSNETALPRAIEAAAKAGVRLRSASYSRPGLEEVFLKHTGRSFAAAQDAAPALPGKRR